LYIPFFNFDAAIGLRFGNYFRVSLNNWSLTLVLFWTGDVLAVSIGGGLPCKI
jgi:hypothetical protein